MQPQPVGSTDIMWRFTTSRPSARPGLFCQRPVSERRQDHMEQPGQRLPPGNATTVSFGLRYVDPSAPDPAATGEPVAKVARPGRARRTSRAPPGMLRTSARAERKRSCPTCMCMDRTGACLHNLYGYQLFPADGERGCEFTTCSSDGIPAAFSLRFVRSIPCCCSIVRPPVAALQAACGRHFAGIPCGQ